MQIFKNLTEHINNQQVILSKYSEKLSIKKSNNIRKEETVIEEIQYMNQNTFQTALKQLCLRN